MEGLIDAAPSEMDELEQLAERASPQELQNLFSMLLRAEGEVRRSTNPWIALDMTVLRMAYAPDIVDLAALVRRIDSAPVACDARTCDAARQRLHFSREAC